MSKEIITIEEVFNIRTGEGGLHNLFDLHEAYIDEDGKFSMELTVQERHLNPLGIAHGATLFALCDCVVGTYLVYQGNWTVTVDSSIQYYRPGKHGDRLKATLTERKKGRTLGTYFVEVTNQDGALLADMTSTFYILDKKEGFAEKDPTTTDTTKDVVDE